MSDQTKSPQPLKIVFDLTNDLSDSEINSEQTASPKEPSNREGPTQDLAFYLSEIPVLKTEKRLLPRVNYWGPVILHQKKPKISLKATTEDINLNGIGIFGSESLDLEVGSEVFAEFPASPQLKSFVVECVVVRKKSEQGASRIGLKVKSLSRLAEKSLRDFLAKADQADGESQK